MYELLSGAVYGRNEGRVHIQVQLRGLGLSAVVQLGAASAGRGVRLELVHQDIDDVVPCPDRDRTGRR